MILPAKAPIQSMPQNFNKKSSVEAQPENGPKDTITISLSSVGSTLHKGARVIAGTTTSLLAAPKSLLKPLVATIDNKTTRTNVEAVTFIGSGAGYGAAAGALFGGPIGAAIGGAIGLVGSLFTGVIASTERSSKTRGREKTVFSYDNIDQARSQARQNTEGSATKKSGAAFTAGYSAAFKESYESGAGLVDATINAAKNSVTKTKEFFSGSLEFVSGATGN